MSNNRARGRGHERHGRILESSPRKLSSYNDICYTHHPYNTNAKNGAQNVNNNGYNNNNSRQNHQNNNGFFHRSEQNYDNRNKVNNGHNGNVQQNAHNNSQQIGYNNKNDVHYNDNKPPRRGRGRTRRFATIISQSRPLNQINLDAFNAANRAKAASRTRSCPAAGRRRRQTQSMCAEEGLDSDSDSDNDNDYNTHPSQLTHSNVAEFNRVNEHTANHQSRYKSQPPRTNLERIPSSNINSMGPFTFSSDEDKDEDEDDDNDTSMHEVVLQKTQNIQNMVQFWEEDLQKVVRENRLTTNAKRSAFKRRNNHEFQIGMNHNRYRHNRESKQLALRDQQRENQIQKMRKKYWMNEYQNSDNKSIISKPWNQLKNNEQLVAFNIKALGISPKSVFHQLPEYKDIRGNTLSDYKYDPYQFLLKCIYDGINVRPSNSKFGGFVFIPIPNEASADTYRDLIEVKCRGFVSATNQWVFGCFSVCGTSGFAVRISQNDYASTEESIEEFIKQFGSTSKPWIIGNRRNLSLIEQGAFNEEYRNRVKLRYYFGIIQDKLRKAPYNVSLPKDRRKWKGKEINQQMILDMRDMFYPIMHIKR